MVDWYKTAVAGSAISGALSLRRANQIQNEGLQLSYNIENRRLQIVESRRILQKITDLVNNLEKESLSEEAKLVILMIGDSVFEDLGLSASAFDELSDIRYASETKTRYLEAIHSLVKEVDGDKVTLLGNLLVSSNFDIECMGFKPTITEPVLSDIVSIFKHQYLRNEYSLRLVSLDYNKSPYIQLRLTDYGVTYDLHIKRSVNKHIQMPNSLTLFDSESNEIMLSKKRKLEHVFDIITNGTHGQRKISISVIFDKKVDKYPSRITLMTNEGFQITSEVTDDLIKDEPIKLGSQKGEGYCTFMGCNSLVFRNTQFCYKHK